MGILRTMNLKTCSFKEVKCVLLVAHKFRKDASNSTNWTFISAYSARNDYVLGRVGMSFGFQLQFAKDVPGLG